jgi:hypothetical protein
VTPSAIITNHTIILPTHQIRDASKDGLVTSMPARLPAASLNCNTATFE